MKALFVTRRYPPSIGGMQNFAYDLHKAISEKTEIRLIKWGGSNAWLPLIVPYFFLRACYETIRFKPDVLHMQDALLAPLGLMLSGLFNKPYTVVVHGLDITYNNSLYQAVIPKAVAKADRVFCISQAAADQTISRGVPADVVEVIPLGSADITAPDKKKSKQQLVKLYPELKNKKILLTVGRLAKRKGVEWFIDNVLPPLANEFEDVVYCVAGEGEEKEKIKQAIEDNNLQSNVKLFGRVDDRTLKLLYGGADVFVMPNIVVENDMEGFGIVLIEAALNELPIVATGIEGILDATKDGESARHIDPDDSSSFFYEVKMFIENPNKAHEFGKRARTYTVENYSWDSIASSYISEYRKVMED